MIMEKLKKSFWLCLLLMFFFINTKVKAEAVTVSEKIKIIYFSNDLLKNLAQELLASVDFQKRLNLRSLIPESATWHEYTLTPRDLNQLSEAHVLFLLGKDIEGFSKKQIQGKIKTLKVIELNEEKLPFKEDKDPHYWNHPLNFIAVAKAVARELILVEPNWQKQVDINLAKIENEIIKVHKNYLSLFAGLKEKTIIISHNSISFYGKAYGIKIFSPTGFNSLDQTIPSDLISIKKMLKDNPKIPLFREVNSNNIFLEKLAKDLGLSIKGDINGESLRGKTYETFLKQNLEVIYSALK